ncbi:MAG: sensor histidine kinase [gamma proteobacterium endosymbiont of Lamellibrachia anaximandri]|nr:sensor histidine kinase [gamma proteobacterium endosymbiont of Lamellibrachia anaximandri]MBL3601078.1 sensor histidine kinase [gamma proteobacterium endosymbiont of Lamellibrachia anaximandri]MBL3618888.1 sensor histidine kinase [gamma proteobacterium endosymbiont of Lamellibrachia anaximandri]
MVGRFPGIDPDEPPDEMSGYTVFDRLVEPIQYSLCELLENALTHARRGSHGSAFVWVAGQYYRSSKIVRLGVTDNGCGFLASLKGHPELRRKRHLDAILTALKPRVSCNRDLGIHDDSVNQGVGLTTVMRIAKHTGGRAVILSGNALHDTDGRSGSTPAGSIWQGVAVALEFRRDQLARTNFRELLPLVEGIPRIPLRFE